MWPGGPDPERFAGRDQRPAHGQRQRMGPRQHEQRHARHVARRDTQTQRGSRAPSAPAGGRPPPAPRPRRWPSITPSCIGQRAPVAGRAERRAAHHHVARRERAVARGIGGPEERHHRRAHGAGQVQRARVGGDHQARAPRASSTNSRSVVGKQRRAAPSEAATTRSARPSSPGPQVTSGSSPRSAQAARHGAEALGGPELALPAAARVQDHERPARPRPARRTSTSAACLVARAAGTRAAPRPRCPARAAAPGSCRSRGPAPAAGSTRARSSGRAESGSRRHGRA